MQLLLLGRQIEYYVLLSVSHRTLMANLPKTGHVSMHSKETLHRVNQLNLHIYPETVTRFLYLGNTLSPKQNSDYKRICVLWEDNGRLLEIIEMAPMWHQAPEEWKQIMTYLELWYSSKFVSSLQLLALALR